MTHLDMVDFRLFVQIAEANSLRQGAERACLSAPAASARIANLEVRTGTKLLMRSSRGVSLTPSGQAFLHHAKLVLGQLEELKSDLEEYAKSVKGHLRLTANPTAMTEFLPSVLARYLPRHPDVSLGLRERFSGEIVRDVLAGTADLGIVSGELRMEDLETIEHRTIPLVVITAPDHPLASIEKTTLGETLQYDFVDFHETSPTHSLLHRTALELHTPIRTRVRAVNVDACCRLVEAGVGVGLVPEPSARRIARSANICIIPLEGPAMELTERIVARRFKALPAFARDFVNELLVKDEDES
ncbi:DNA-binding transcriptional LysR family regulator [Sphingomonas vulcanisoli]|uniref:DNA-binding transcriptional LysR family regulator n=1 Tax=Sphingomonas vulcanisoli TaxID=1658060 RepID=A0ABX0TTA8_9SPHN|nr:LysR family transcriptional regulator [Sphingomonas vulcanisoli]NIJ08753.1 DNA-binding transcriptional LysR family regulator [Sphingomonas vulcanisoli]